MGPTPLRQASRASNKASGESPSGVMTPMPVMTTLLGTALLPPADDQRRALPAVGAGGLQGVRVADAPRLAHHVHRAVRPGGLVVEGRGQLPLAQGEDAGGELDRGGAAVERAGVA